MNDLRNILYFISKYVNFVNSFLTHKEYLIERSFIAMFWKAFKISYKSEYYNKTHTIKIGIFI